MRRSPSPLFLLALLVLAAACGGGGGRRTAAVQPAVARLCSILVEVYDPTTNFVWENVSVRVVEADQEWSNCTCVSPYEDWYLTDATGRVLIDEYVLADAAVGFQVDAKGRAVLGPRSYEDQATVWLEVAAPGFLPVLVEVPLSWEVPDVFVEVPFH